MSLTHVQGTVRWIWNWSVERGALVALLRPPHEFKWAPLRNELLEEDVLPSIILEERAKSGSVASVEKTIEHAQTLIEGWEASGARFLPYLDEQYPRQLREVHDLPPFIFTRGRLASPGTIERGISVVGSREASPERQGAQRVSVLPLARYLGETGPTIEWLQTSAAKEPFDPHFCPVTRGKCPPLTAEEIENGFSVMKLQN